MSEWNSIQYLKFKGERTKPAIDLVNNINCINPQDIIDVGCGPGNSTAVLLTRYPNANIIGIDNSLNMIETATDNYPDLNFMVCDASKELLSIDKKFDIVFSNACIQWIPNHEILLKDMMSLLNKGGILAVQIPVNYEEPIHKIILETSTSDKWINVINITRGVFNLSQAEYFDILSEISSDFSMWQTTYFHRMKSHNDIIEWYRSTGLRPYLSVLNDEQKIEFEKDVFEKILKAYPKQENGEIVFRFPRLFFTAVK